MKQKIRTAPNSQGIVITSRTTDGPTARPDSQGRSMTIAQAQALDAGYWFRPGSYSHDPSIPPEEFI